jgi:hypothetical protein
MSLLINPAPSKVLGQGKHKCHNGSFVTVFIEYKMLPYLIILMEKAYSFAITQRSILHTIFIGHS